MTTQKSNASGPAPEPNEIDWANVASEVGEMLKLNESAYKAQKAAYGTTGEPSEAEEE